MKNKPFGCISVTGILAVAISMMLILGAWVWQGGAYFSPGDLNNQPGEQVLGGVRTHAETGGQCSACHAAPWSGERMSDRCLDCHSVLFANLEDFHAVMLAQGSAGACNDCHPEHRGAQGELTALELARFPHNAVGYSLQAHQELVDGEVFACTDCHVTGFAQFELTTCADCHSGMDSAFMQTHLLDFGVECLACHDGFDRFGVDFDHNRAPFALMGGHAILICSDCHQTARTLADLINTPQACVACHTDDDPHQGGFGQDCAGCHTPEGWDQASFDHALASFALTGAHTAVACEDCHQGGVFKGTPLACFACHVEDDAHQGRFGQDCTSCHTPEGWDQASFDHSLASFPLTGAHIEIPCGDCHIDGQFKGTPMVCYACHAEPTYHVGLFDLACETCHTTQVWSPAEFDGLHTFPINHGESGWNACQTCHVESLAGYTCYGCHEHDQAEIAAEHREEGISDFMDCSRCHPTGREDEAESGDD